MKTSIKQHGFRFVPEVASADMLWAGEVRLTGTGVKGALPEPAGDPLAPLSPVMWDLFLTETSTTRRHGMWQELLPPPALHTQQVLHSGRWHTWSPATRSHLLSTPLWGEVASAPAILPRCLTSSSAGIRTKQSEARVDVLLIIYTWATVSVNALTCTPPPQWCPPRPQSSTDSSLASNALASFSSNNVSEPRQAVASFPLRRVSPSMNTHLTGFNGTVRGATKPNSTVLSSPEFSAFWVWPPANLSPVRFVFCSNSIQRKWRVWVTCGEELMSSLWQWGEIFELPSH